MSAPRVSLVIPVFNEETNLPELLDRTSAVAATIAGGCEIVLVDDGSRDGSVALLRAAAAERSGVVAVELNRNYGQHAAVFAGFAAARGEILVTLDADLQNPPEEIPKLVARMDEGYDVVGSVRAEREDSFFRRAASRIVNRLTRRIIGGQLHDYGCMLRAYRRSVVETFTRSREVATFIPVLAELFAGRVTEVTVEHKSRARGTSKYNLWRLIRLEFDLLTSFSVLPLRATMAIGAFTALVSLVAALVLLAGRLIYGQEWAVSGVFTLFAVLFALLGVMLFALGMLGEYVGRIYVGVRDRPRYVVREVTRSEKETVA
jgi:undecaprenyl-phosphate 4-deoxy-4-formamido-L-arabinose transferase